MTASFRILVDTNGCAVVVWTIDHKPSVTLNEMARLMNDALAEYANIFNLIGTAPIRPLPPAA